MAAGEDIFYGLERAGNTLLDNLVRFELCQGFVLKTDIAAIRNIVSCNKVENRCFSCPVRTDDTDDGTVGDFKTHIVDSFNSAERFCDIFQRKQGSIHIMRPLPLWFSVFQSTQKEERTCGGGEVKFPADG